MVRDVKEAQGGAEIAGREIERPLAAGLSEAQAQRRRLSGYEIEPHALPMVPVAVQLGDDVARLAFRTEDDARELAVDHERWIVVAAGSGLGQIVEQRSGVERPAREIGPPAAFGTASQRTGHIGLAERELFQLDALHALARRTIRGGNAQPDTLTLDRRLANGADAIIGKIDLQLGRRRRAWRFRPVEVRQAHCRAAEIE